MPYFKRHTLRSWPILAITLMTAFIVYGVTLISRSGQLQVKISKEVTLLDELSRLTGTLLHL